LHLVLQVVTTVLQLVVQHAELELAQVASWLQLSRSIRAALQQSVGDLKLEFGILKYTAQHLTAIAHWLPGHANLVSTLSMWTRPDIRNSPEWAAAEQLFSRALQFATSSSRAELLPALQLKALWTNFMFDPAALKAIAGSTRLQALSLSDMPPQRFTTQLCTALGRLQGLQCLRFKLQDPSGVDALLPRSMEFAAAVADLTKPGNLTINWVLPEAGFSLLPASLTHLDTEMRNAVRQAAPQVAAAGGGGTPLDLQMSHLTKLQSLYLTVSDGISAQSQLPACLAALTVTGPAEAVPGLSQLQRLHLGDAHAAMPLLQHTKQQPMLQRLDLALHSCSPGKVEDALAACTGLTKLHLYNKHWYLFGIPAEERGPSNCVVLSGLQLQLHKLTRLQRMKLTQVRWDFEGFSQLTVLTNLTFLKLNTCDIAELGMAVVFQRLTGLRKLGLETCLPANNFLLMAMACLTNLECLCVSYHHLAFTDVNLPLLSPLTKLTRLALDAETSDEGDPLVSEAVNDAFMAGMPHLKSIEWYED
jgi:hypothetical protein